MQLIKIRISNHWVHGWVLKDLIIRKINYQLINKQCYYNYLIGNGIKKVIGYKYINKLINI